MMGFTLEVVAKFDPVAYYAAIVATCALGWNIFIWLRTGPRLGLRITTGMILFPAPMGFSEKDEFIIYTVSNTGTAPTTITHVLIYGYDGLFSFLRRKPVKSAVVNSGPPITHALPYVLKIGETYTAMAKQTEDLREWSRKYRLYGAIVHSGSSREIRARIQPIAEANA